MASRMGHRIGNLERTLRAKAGLVCPDCGLPRPPAPLPKIMKLVVNIPESVYTPGPQPLPDTSGDACPGCGRVLVLRVPPPGGYGQQED